MTKINRLFPYLFMFFLTALVLDLANPAFGKPSRDGGFFLYAGSEILNGKIPYLEVWDNKGPGIFYINALGLYIGGGSRWGVWLVEFLFIFVTFTLLHRSLLKRWGSGAALFGVTMAGLGLRIALGYGNYTEEYALLFNAIGLYLFFAMADSDRNNWHYFWIGVMFGLSFNFRANNIGGLFAIFAAIFIFEVFKGRFLNVLKNILIALAGFTLPLLLWTGYFGLLGGAEEMIYGAITFNFSYSAAKDREWLDLFGGFGRYGISGYGWVTLVAWFVLVLRAMAGFAQRKLTVFETFLLLWFPIEILLSNLSGRNFTHYYISWTLAVAVYSAFLFAEIWQAAFKVSSLQGWSDDLGVYFSIGLSVLIFVLFPSFSGRYVGTINGFFRSEEMEYIDPISAYIRDNSDPDDLVLTWYPERGINFMSGRSSPVKYTNYPLFLEGSLTEEIEDRYIEDLTETPPQLILDCSRSVDAIPSLDPATREEQYATPGVKRKMYIQPGMDEIFEFVEANYQIENTIDGCLIFRLNQD